ncbi:MAG: hypothetical protein ACFHXK_08070 [bacterium]
MKHLQLFLQLALVALLAGCASGSAIITGEIRPTIDDHSAVRILTAMPEGVDVIAIVKASSDAGWTQQDAVDYAVEELKKQAAKVGANAVVLTGRDTSSQTVTTPVYNAPAIVTTSETEIVQGLAVWVE